MLLHPPCGFPRIAIGVNRASTILFRQLQNAFYAVQALIPLVQLQASAQCVVQVPTLWPRGLQFLVAPVPRASTSPAQGLSAAFSVVLATTLPALPRVPTALQAPLLLQRGPHSAASVPQAPTFLAQGPHSAMHVVLAHTALAQGQQFAWGAVWELLPVPWAQQPFAHCVQAALSLLALERVPAFRAALAHTPQALGCFLRAHVSLVALASTSLALALLLGVFPVELAAMQQGWGPPSALCVMLGTTQLDWDFSTQTRAAPWMLDLLCFKAPRMLFLFQTKICSSVQQERSVILTM